MALLFLTALSSCNYSFRAGVGFPDHIRTVAVLPFENRTTRFELTQELHQKLFSQLPRALGLRNSSEELADAVVRGTIKSYSLTAPSYRKIGSGTEVIVREVRISLQVEILDRQENLVLWESQSVFADGQYLEASETEEIGRAQAIEILVQAIVDGAQSNW